MLYHELCRAYGYAGSYPAFIRHLRMLRPDAATEPVVRFETAPGVQVQADWAHLGVWPLEETMADLFGLVAILGYSRVPTVRLAADHTRMTTLERLVHCLDDLGGAPQEILTDRDPVFCIGQSSDGKAILAPEWVDQWQVLDVAPRVCRPYRAKTKGKVERLVREVKESFLAWLGGQIAYHADAGRLRPTGSTVARRGRFAAPPPHDRHGYRRRLGGRAAPAASTAGAAAAGSRCPSHASSTRPSAV